MSDHTLVFRPANRSFEDGLEFAKYANEASEGFMQTLFGRQYRQIIANAFLEPDHDTSYQNVTFAETDDAIVGMILAYTEAQHRRSSIEPQRKAAGKLRLRMRFVELMLAPVMHLSDSMEEGDYYLQFIAVDQNRRVDGVGTSLMDELERQARAKGCTRLSLDVSVSNLVARRFYENRGWCTDFEWPKNRFMPTLSVRMIKHLDNDGG